MPADRFSASNLPPGCHPLCRACRHRSLDQDESLGQKSDFLRQMLQPWAAIIEDVRSLNGSKRWSYRRKTTLGAEFDGLQWRWGLHRRDQLLHIPDCPVHHPGLNEAVKSLMASLPMSDFGLRWLVVSGKQLSMVVKAKAFSLENWPPQSLLMQLEAFGFEALWLHLNPSTGKRIFGKGGWKLLWGRPFSIDDLGLRYSPAAFSQLIPDLYAESLREALAFLSPDLQAAVVDLYSGTGSSVKQWQKTGAQVIGVEAVPEAVGLAAVNVPQAEILTGACRLRIPQLDQWVSQRRAEGKTILLYANPPRTGIEPEVLHWITAKAQPLRMAYLSCSPGTLSRNLLYLTQNGYRPVRLIPFDFFPQTQHVETLALIERTDP